MKIINTTANINIGNSINRAKKPYILLPEMTPEDFRKTFKNYENTIAEYNAEITQKNKKISAYNKNFAKDSLTQHDIDQAKKFKLKIQNLTTSTYNQNVALINKNYGKNILKMRFHKKLHYATQRVFAEIVKQAAKTLRNRNRNLINIGASTRIEKNSPVDIAIWRSKIAKELDIAEKTVYNNIRRLMQANILIGYKYRGTNKSFIVQINPKILSISDNILNKNNKNIQNVENQFFKTINGKELPYNVLVKQESYKEKNKENDNVKNITKKGILNNDATASNLNNNKNTVSKYVQNDDETNTGGANILNKYSKISKRLKTNILHYYIFAVQLATGLFNNYKPIRNDVFKLEILYGTLTREEFREVLIQEFIKISAKLWRNWKKGIYTGQWIKTIKLLNEIMFITNNGHLPQKETMFQMFLIYKWRLKSVINYQAINPEWIIQAPVNYFNPKLKTIGFAKTKQFYKNNQKQREKIKKIIDDLNIEAYKIENKRAVYKQIEYRINKMKAGNMTLNELVNWTKFNTYLTEKELMKFINYKNSPNEKL